MPRRKSAGFRDRIRELRRVRAGDLLPSPHNWRTHPKAQEEALRGVLAEVGYADAVIARELPDGALELLDGHLRAGLAPDQVVPVLVVDLDDAEAAKLLATLDPLGAMAEADPEKLTELLREIDTGSEAVQAMLSELAENVGIIPEDGDDLPGIEETTRHTVVVPYDDADLPALRRFLDVKKLPPALGKAIHDRICGPASRQADKRRRAKDA